MSYRNSEQIDSGAYFTNNFSIVIQIQSKIGFSVTPLEGIILLQLLHMPPQHSCRAMSKIT